MRLEATVEEGIVEVMPDGTRKAVNAPRGVQVINLDTGKEIERCTMADDVTGEYEQLMVGFEGMRRERGTARLKIVFLDYS